MVSGEGKRQRWGVMYKEQGAEGEIQEGKKNKERFKALEIKVGSLQDAGIDRVWRRRSEEQGVRKSSKWL